MVRHLKTVSDVSAEEITSLISLANDLKFNPEKYQNALCGKTMLMLFEKPSLRTRVSFETGMTQLGGHAIFYSIKDSPLGKKENIHDTAKCLTEYVDIIMARVNKKADIDALAEHADIPVLNGLDDWAHPCQILSDVFTMMEKKGSLQGLKIAYYGDCNNNVTYDIMRAAAIMGMHMKVVGPQGEAYEADPAVYEECANLCTKSGGSVVACHEPLEGSKDCDVIYTDSWQSYHIAEDLRAEREKAFTPFRVTEEVMKQSKPDCIFMNCLPAARGAEQTAEVIDGPQSVVFTQAGNRLHMQKAITMFFLDAMPKPSGARKLLVALGGNALLQPGEKGTADDQFKNARTASEQLAELVKRGHKLTITHGNGPQVGAIFLQNDIAKKSSPQMPLFVNGAMSQGFIGFMMQQEMTAALTAKHITNTPVATVVTQTLVDKTDAAFKNPTKPIGPFYSKEEADELTAKGFTMMEDSGRGYRIIVPSPQPREIIEAPAIRAMMEGGCVTICNGGGGIPVIRNDKGEIEGVNAVIDKDLGGEVLAKMLNVDHYMILTDVETVFLDYKKPTQRAVRKLTVREARELLADGQFGKGSMGPKVEAACRFAEKSGRASIITSLSKACDALEGLAGTRIYPN